MPGAPVKFKRPTSGCHNRSISCLASSYPSDGVVDITHLLGLNFRAHACARSEIEHLNGLLARRWNATTTFFSENSNSNGPSVSGLSGTPTTLNVPCGFNAER